MAIGNNSSNLLKSFSYVAKTDATLLILGSMPGKVSLTQNEYYAHPRNAFWPIMSHLLGFPLALAYPLRLQKLLDNQVALWDVMKHCERDSSLDADILESSIVANDFSAFLNKHTDIKVIALNGKKAEQSFHRHVWKDLSAKFPSVRPIGLPSTSPANARISLEQKRDVWINHLNKSPIARG